jgi:hypothetical protein
MCLWVVCVCIYIWNEFMGMPMGAPHDSPITQAACRGYTQRAHGLNRHPEMVHAAPRCMSRFTI